MNALALGRPPTRRTSDPLVAAVLGRARSVFADDVKRNEAALLTAIEGRRLLVIGAAGSIGAALVEQLVPYRPAVLHLVDLSENGLVEVVRDVRSSPRPVAELSTFAIDLRAEEMLALVRARGPYDHVLSFAALKHVRAERDPFTLTRMLDTNVLAVDRLLRALAGSGARFFSVSSDKAVRPANLMGASKAFMERVMAKQSAVPIASARFANVAFSSGSLLDGFLYRLEKRQPLAGPNDVERYFISHEEAGQLCLLAAFLGEHREVLVPKDGVVSTRTFASIAREVLAFHGLEADECESESEARARAGSIGDRPRRWPCYFAASDTTGEKEREEFVAAHERADDERHLGASVVALPVPGAEIERALADLNRHLRAFDAAELHAIVARAVPDLVHRDEGRSLDQKM